MALITPAQGATLTSGGSSSLVDHDRRPIRDARKSPGVSVIPLGSTLEDANYLSDLGGLDTGVVMTSLIELVWAATAAGIAIGLYPVLGMCSRALALGSVAARPVEGVFVLIGTLALLALLTVSQQSLAAGPAARSSYGPVGDALLALRAWAPGFIAILALAIGGLLYYFVLYTSRLIPPWLSGWGLVGAAFLLVSTGDGRTCAGLRFHHGEHRAQHPDRSPRDGLGRVADRQRIRPVGLATHAGRGPRSSGKSDDSMESEPRHRVLRPS